MKCDYCSWYGNYQVAVSNAPSAYSCDKHLGEIVNHTLKREGAALFTTVSIVDDRPAESNEAAAYNASVAAYDADLARRQRINA